MSSNVVSVLHTKRYRAALPSVLSGEDLLVFNTDDPLRLWIIQIGIIISTTQILAFGLRRIRQPRVIAEVLGGIVLGPTALGRVPGFTEHVFPLSSRPYLSLVADIGLCLFLFIVGLEIEGSMIRRNARFSIVIGFAGMAIPFGLGAALSIPIYNRFIDHSIPFALFMLFTGMAYSITAFAILCRILTELKLLGTTVGIVTISAGVGNDVLGLTLLALSVALVNAESGLTALWILLICAGWVLFMLFPVRYVSRWFARYTGSVENGPTTLFMTFTMLVAFASAFFTDVIGVHAIFGAFLAGITVSREGGLPVALTVKLGDMVYIIFLPLYFTLSGLSTDLGLLDDYITWAYTAAICAVAFIGKFGACSLAARLLGLTWREAGAIGSLMSCKGLVELIVLNVGLSAGIISQRVFSMFVVEGLVLTFITTPLVTVLYPPECRVRPTAIRSTIPRAADRGDGLEAAESSNSRSSCGEEHIWKRHFTVMLDKAEHLPGMMALTQLIIPPAPHPPRGAEQITPSNGKSVCAAARCSIDALRIIELSDGLSAVMKSSAASALQQTDTLLGIFRVFGELNDVAVSTAVSIVPYDQFAVTIAEHASANASDLILIPWLHSSEPGIVEGKEQDMEATPVHSTAESFVPTFYSNFVLEVFSLSNSDVALFVDGGHGESDFGGSAHHVYLPFFGGPDDRLALDFVVQLCANPHVSATVVLVTKGELTGAEPALLDGGSRLADKPSFGWPGAVNPLGVSRATMQTMLQSGVADAIAWKRYTSHLTFAEYPATFKAALSRVEFTTLTSPIPLHAIVQAVTLKQAVMAEQRTRLLVVSGRSRRLPVDDHGSELKELTEGCGSGVGEIQSVVGDVATAFVASGFGMGVVVLQAADATPHWQ